MIRLAAFDLDGTLVDTDLNLSPRLQKSMSHAQQLGLIITIATGRDARLTTRFAKELGLTAPIICAQGGLIYDFINDHVLHDVRLPPEILPRVVDAAKQYGWNLHFEMADQSFLPSISNHPPILFELLRYSKWSRLKDILHDIPDVPHKFLVTLNHPDDRLRVMSELCAVFNGQIRIVPSHPYLIEGVPKDVTKGSGLAWLATYFNIPQFEVMAVGDNDNDVPMIEWAGLGVAIGNASVAAKVAADWIAPPVEEDGVAIAIEKYILGQNTSK
jgi:Cof subfamily protein (haloacid dehalogenase superfamily)